MKLVFLIAVLFLGHPNFAVRETVQRYLATNASLALPELFSGEKLPDQEIAGRCRVIANGYLKHHMAEVVNSFIPYDWDDLPWMVPPPDQVPKYYECNTYIARAQLVRYMDDPPRLDIKRLATWLFIQDRIMARQPVADRVKEFCQWHRWICEENGWPLQVKDKQ